MVGRMASLLKGCNFAEVCSILGKDEALNANRYARSEAIVLSDVLKDEIDRVLTFVDERRAFSSYFTLKIVGWIDEEALKKKLQLSVSHKFSIYSLNIELSRN